MTSLWLDHRPPTETDAFEPDASYDVVVVGAGLTGLATALLLSRAGLSVTVLEARFLGAVTTGNTTAKLSLLQGTVFSGIRRHFPAEIVQAYVEGNREGQSWLLRYLEEQAVPVQRRDAYTYATSDSGAASLEREAQAGRDAGLDIALLEGDIGLPYATRAALHLPDQAQFHPLQVLDALAADLRSRGGRIVEGHRVREVSGGTPATVRTDRGSVRAQHVILATGTPILDRGMYFAKLEPSRSYAAAYRVPTAAGALPQGMYLSVDQPARSLRTVPVDGAELLLVGGNGHPVGKNLSEHAQVKDLDDWTAQQFPGAERTHRWSAQDYRSANMVPFVGKLPRGGGNIHVATGYNKWGMTNAVAAALDLSAGILGGSVPWAQTLSHRITGPADLAEGVKLNAGVAGKLAKGWLGALFNDEDDAARPPAEPAPSPGTAPAADPAPSQATASAADPAPSPGTTPTAEQASSAGTASSAEPAEAHGGQQSPSVQPASYPREGQGAPAEGEGRMLRHGLHPVGVSTVGGRTCRVSGVCTHLGGILSWNDAEKSWDCPLHGSRFTADGTVLEGPTTEDLELLEPGAAPAASPGPGT